MSATSAANAAGVGWSHYVEPRGLARDVSAVPCSTRIRADRPPAIRHRFGAVMRVGPTPGC